MSLIFTVMTIPNVNIRDPCLDKNIQKKEEKIVNQNKHHHLLPSPSWSMLDDKDVDVPLPSSSELSCSIVLLCILLPALEVNNSDINKRDQS